MSITAYLEIAAIVGFWVMMCWKNEGMFAALLILIALGGVASCVGAKPSHYEFEPTRM